MTALSRHLPYGVKRIRGEAAINPGAVEGSLGFAQDDHYESAADSVRYQELHHVKVVASANHGSIKSIECTIRRKKLFVLDVNKNRKRLRPQKPQPFDSIILDHDARTFEIIADPVDEIFRLRCELRSRMSRKVTQERIRRADTSAVGAELPICGLKYRREHGLRARLQKALDGQTVVEALCR